MEIKNSLQNTAHSLIVIFGLGYLLYLGSSLILPLVFAALIATFLYPIDKRILLKVKKKGISIVLSFLVVLLPISIVGTLFSVQLMKIMDSLPSIEKKLKSGIDEALNSIESIFPFLDLNRKELIEDAVNADLSGPASFVTQGLMNTTSILVSIALTFIYTFFFLYYRKSFNNFVIFQFEKSSRSDIKNTMSQIKDTIQAYIGGLGVLMLILATLNSIGLAIIGVEHAIFWGALAGLLAIIPYIGTIIGGMLPFLYTLATTDNFHQPLAVVVFYTVVQQLEGNFITPKVVGDKVDINPLFAILALIFLGSFWGVAGVILALPIISIARIILEQFESTQPYAMLMSSNLDNRPGQFRKWADS